MIVERMDRVTVNLQKEEGFSRWVYDDHLGVKTIGYGRNVDKGANGPGITADEAMVLLQNDIKRVAAELAERLPWVTGLDPDRRECLVEMSYQLGWPRLSKFVLMLAALKSGDWNESADQLLDSRYAKQTPARVERYAARLRG